MAGLCVHIGILVILCNLCCVMDGALLYEGDSCSTGLGSTGVCKRLTACSGALEQLVNSGRRPQLCSFDRFEQIVCCSEQLSRSQVDIPNAELAKGRAKEMCERYTRLDLSDEPPSESSTPLQMSSSLISASPLPLTSSMGSQPPQTLSTPLQMSSPLKRASPLPLTSSMGSHPPQSTSTPATRVLNDRIVFRRLRRRRSETLDANVVNPYILDGHRARVQAFPHMAAIGFGTNDIAWLCGGSLVSENYVLTAAHCLYTKGRGNATWVQVGDLLLDPDNPSTHRQQLRVVDRVPHPDYKPPAYYNDVALLRLEKAVRFTAFSRPACLHTETVIRGGRCTATGWGVTNWTTSESSQHLMEVDLPIQDSTACNATFEPLRLASRKLMQGILDESMLCVGEINGSKDTCKGDSGGPIQVRTESSSVMYSIIGVTSFGTSCGPATSPAVYMRVSHYVPWITSIVWPPKEAH